MEREVGAGIVVSPNATRILHRLGLAEALEETAVRTLAWHERRSRHASRRSAHGMSPKRCTSMRCCVCQERRTQGQSAANKTHLHMPDGPAQQACDAYVVDSSAGGL